MNALQRKGCEEQDVIAQLSDQLTGGATQAEVAMTYADALGVAGFAHWPLVNGAIIERWSVGGLKRVKEAAWKIADARRSSTAVAVGVSDSPRWCQFCKAWGHHHTDRCPVEPDRDRKIAEAIAATDARYERIESGWHDRPDPTPAPRRNHTQGDAP